MQLLLLAPPPLLLLLLMALPRPAHVPCPLPGGLQAQDQRRHHSAVHNRGGERRGAQAVDEGHRQVLGPGCWLQRRWAPAAGSGAMRSCQVLSFASEHL